MNRLVAGARHAAGTVIGWGFETFGGPPPGLAPGRSGLDDRPVVVVLLLEADADTVAATAAELGASVDAGGPRPILVLDRPNFALARRAGIAADHVISRVDWERRYPDRPWTAYIEAEKVRLRGDFRAQVVTLPGQGLAALPAAARRNLLAPRRVRPWQRLMAGLERRVDRGSGG